jgi:hypothetical protein
MYRFFSPLYDVGSSCLALPRVYVNSEAAEKVQGKGKVVPVRN